MRHIIIGTCTYERWNKYKKKLYSLSEILQNKSRLRSYEIPTTTCASFMFERTVVVLNYTNQGMNKIE